MGLSHSPSIVTNGLVLCLDAGNIKSYNAGISTTAWNDLSGGGNIGTMTNGPTYNSANGGSIVFDGVNDIVSFGNLNRDIYHFSSWCYLNSSITSVSANTGFFKYSFNSNLQAGLNFGASTGLVSGETLTIFYENPPSTFYRTAITNNIASGWNYISLNWNGSNYDIYINSLTQTTTSGTSAGHVSLINASDFTLGYGYNTTFLFSGRMSQVSIYNRALTASEIRQNFNALRGRYGL